jgi:tRNA 2-thiouridine synthesizing protein E
MPYIEYNGTQIEVDEEGFITDPSIWDEDLARFLAAEAEGITDLNDDHWIIIHYLHEYYQENHAAPLVRKLCNETNIGLKDIYKLFPSGPAKGACKVAGLPKAQGCV